VTSPSTVPITAIYRRVFEAMKSTNTHVPSQSVLEERFLIERCMANDKSAFRTLIDNYKSMVFSLAVRMLGDRDAAEDVAQDVFIRVYKALPAFEQRSSLKTWIYRITMNLAMNYRSRWRSRKREKHVSIEHVPFNGKSLADRLPHGAKNPEQIAEHVELTEHIQEGLAKLPPVFKAAVILRDVDGLSYEEIAEILGIREGTVKSRINRGRDQLKSLLAPYLRMA